MNTLPFTIDRSKFFPAVRSTVFAGKLTQDQVDGLNLILDYAAKRPPVDPRFLGYRLATTTLETGRTMQPIEEWGRGNGRAYGPSGYWGRGYVQLTWVYNYALWEKRLNLPLVKNPALAMTSAVALPVLFDGMDLGLFTGRKLGDYFNGLVDDPVNARRIINGTDHAEDFALAHRQYMAAINISKKVNV